MKSSLENAEMPVSQAFLLICEKCGKKLGSSDDDNPARTIQKYLKEKIKDDFGKDKMRAVLGSCQNLCPKGQIVVSVLPTHEGAIASGPKTYVVDAPESGEELSQIWTDLKKTF